MVRRFLCATACLVLLAACDTAPGGNAATSPPTPNSSTPTPPADPGFGRGITPQASDGSLTGYWSRIPRAPLSDRSTANVAWTGRWLFVWGGSTGHGDVQLGDGAAWDVTTGKWQALPPAPLTPRSAANVVWTGREVIVWGGVDQVDAAGVHPTSDGAAWDPATNTWTKLPAAPLPSGAGLGTWTGTRMVLLSVHPATQTGDESYLDGASYDPRSRTWRMLPVAKSAEAHPIVLRAAVATDHGLLAWSIWSVETRIPNPPGSVGGVETETHAGWETYRYDPDTDRWSLVPPTTGAMPVEQAIWTGSEVIARGDGFLCARCGGFRPETTRVYRPDTNAWTEVPADPLGADHQISAWAGGLFSFNPGGEYGRTKPGDASAWNPTTDTWRHLPSAPTGCDPSTTQGQEPAFQDGRIAYWCPHTRTGPASQHDGLMYTLTPTTTPTPADVR